MRDQLGEPLSAEGLAVLRKLIFGGVRDGATPAGPERPTESEERHIVKHLAAGIAWAVDSDPEGWSAEEHLASWEAEPDDERIVETPAIGGSITRHVGVTLTEAERAEVLRQANELAYQRPAGPK